jgi:type II secretory pathway component PulK
MKLRSIAVLLVVAFLVIGVAPARSSVRSDLRAMQHQIASLKAQVTDLKAQVRTLRKKVRRNTLRDYCEASLTFSWISLIERNLIQEPQLVAPYPDPPGTVPATPCSSGGKENALDPRSLWPVPPPGGPLLPYRR